MSFYIDLVKHLSVDVNVEHLLLNCKEVEKERSRREIALIQGAAYYVLHVLQYQLVNWWRELCKFGKTVVGLKKVTTHDTLQ